MSGKTLLYHLISSDDSSSCLVLRYQNPPGREVASQESPYIRQCHLSDYLTEDQTIPEL